MATSHSYSMHFSKQVALLCGIKGKTLLLSGRSVGWLKRVLFQIGINTPWQLAVFMTSSTIKTRMQVIHVLICLRQTIEHTDIAAITHCIWRRSHGC